MLSVFGIKLNNVALTHLSLYASVTKAGLPFLKGTSASFLVPPVSFLTSLMLHPSTDPLALFQGYVLSSSSNIHPKWFLFINYSYYTKFSL